MIEVRLRGKYRDHVALIDDADFEIVRPYKWRGLRVKNLIYARTQLPGGATMLMHRMIFGPSELPEIDHFDGNGLNNQRRNLRACTHGGNMQNSLSGRRRGLIWRHPDEWLALLD